MITDIKISVHNIRTHSVIIWCICKASLVELYRFLFVIEFRIDKYGQDSYRHARCGDLPA